MWFLSLHPLGLVQASPNSVCCCCLVIIVVNLYPNYILSALLVSADRLQSVYLPTYPKLGIGNF